jgi:hypothetical protein
MLAGTLAVACVSTESRVYQSAGVACSELLAHYPNAVKASDYADIPASTRSEYEMHVARCEVEQHDDKAALALADSWPAAAASSKLRIHALVAAQLRNEADCRAALEELGASNELEPEFLTENWDLNVFGGRDWFLRVAARSWARRPEGDLSGFVATLLKNGRVASLSLGLAEGDPTLPAGQWAFWTGIVREGRIDRSAGFVSLTLEEVQISTELRSIDRKVTAVNGQTTPSFIGRRWTSTPEYDTERDYEESFTPTGRRFVVRYQAADERLLDARTVQAFGNFAGRDEGSQLPELNAIMVAERKAQQTTEHNRD